jgi:hypothetical protein
MPTTNVETFTPVELAAVRPDLMVIIPITVASGAGNLAQGTAMGKVTATGKFKAYNNAATDGTDVCLGFLAHAVDATSADTVAGLIIGGYLRESKLIGLDAAGKTDLGAISLPNDILKF